MREGLGSTHLLQGQVGRGGREGGRGAGQGRGDARRYEGGRAGPRLYEGGKQAGQGRKTVELHSPHSARMPWRLCPAHPTRA